FGTLVAGSAFLEIVFSWTGMGQYGIQAVQTSGINAVTGNVLFSAVIILFDSTLSVVLYAALAQSVMVWPMAMLASPPSDAPEDLDPAAELPEDATAASRRKRSLSRPQLVWRRLKRKPNFWIGGTFLTLIVGFALLGNIPNIYDLNQRDPYGFNAPPGAQHWFGADAIGIDLYASLTAALRKSLLIGLIAAPAATVIAA